MKSNDSFVHNLRSDFHMTQRTLAPVRFSDGLTGVGWRTDLILVEMQITLMVVSNRLAYHSDLGRGDRAVEGARLEIVCTPNKGTGGSNPPLSAIYIRLGYALNAFILKTLHEQLDSFPCCSFGLRSPPL